MIEEGIAAGKKFSIEDMGAMQQDVVDVMARRQVPNLIKIAVSIKTELNAKQREDLDFILSILEKWDFKMDEESIGATVYAFAILEFNKSLFHAYESDPEERASMLDGYL